MYLKNFLRKITYSLGIQEELKNSFMYKYYLYIFYPNYIKEKKREIDFYKYLFEKNKNKLLIFDIGANDGSKSYLFKILGAKIIAVEPDKTNFSVLKKKYTNSIVIINKAISDKNGIEEFFVTTPGSPFNTLSNKFINVLKDKNYTRFDKQYFFFDKYDIETITLDELINSYGIPDYIKLDIEGYEINAVKGLSYVVPLISFELNLPEFKDEGLEIIKRLNKLSKSSTFNYILEVNNGFKLENWYSYKDFYKYLQENKLRYMEVFCKMI